MADVTLMKSAAEQQLEAQWQEAKSRLPGPATMRAAAFDRFASAGLPHRRIEEWKYTDLRALMRDARPLAAPPDAAAKARVATVATMLESIEARRVVFVDGAFVPELSDLAGLEDGLRIRSMASALADNDPEIAAHLSKVAPSEDVAVAL